MDRMKELGIISRVENFLTLHNNKEEIKGRFRNLIQKITETQLRSSSSDLCIGSDHRRVDQRT